MIRLPSISDGSRTWRFPVSAQAVWQLLDAVLQHDRGLRAAAFLELLQCEPGLVLWSLCRGDRFREKLSASLPEMAEWLADRVGDNLLWIGDDSISPADPGDAVRVAGCRLALQSLAVAQEAAEQAADKGEDPEQAYLRGLLHNRSAWFALAEGSSAEAAFPSPPQLAWLAADGRLNANEAKAGQPKSSDPPRRAVAEACQRALDSPVPYGEADPDIAARWDAPLAAGARLLPLLLQRLHRLAALEHRFQQTLEEEKLAAMKALAYGASHEINNPLANISTRAQTLLREEPDPERRRKLAVINSQAFRAHELISDLMLFARPPRMQAEAVDVTGVIDRVVAELRGDAERQRTRLQRSSPADPLVMTADESYLSVSLKAICSNALEAVASGGSVEVSCAPIGPPDGYREGDAWIAIQVRDTGPGVSDEVRRHLFDPFFSGREAGRGLGLGLSKAWRLISEHGGRIDVESGEGRGTTFIIKVPRDGCLQKRTAH